LLLSLCAHTMFTLIDQYVFAQGSDSSMIESAELSQSKIE